MAKLLEGRYFTLNAVLQISQNCSQLSAWYCTLQELSAREVAHAARFTAQTANPKIFQESKTQLRHSTFLQYLCGSCNGKYICKIHVEFLQVGRWRVKLEHRDNTEGGISTPHSIYSLQELEDCFIMCTVRLQNFLPLTKISRWSFPFNLFPLIPRTQLATCYPP